MKPINYEDVVVLITTESELIMYPVNRSIITKDNILSTVCDSSGLLVFNSYTDEYPDIRLIENDERLVLASVMEDSEYNNLASEFMGVTVLGDSVLLEKDESGNLSILDKDKLFTIYDDLMDNHTVLEDRSEGLTRYL